MRMLNMKVRGRPLWLQVNFGVSPWASRHFARGSQRGELHQSFQAVVAAEAAEVEVEGANAVHLHIQDQQTVSVTSVREQ